MKIYSTPSMVNPSQTTPTLPSPIFASARKWEPKEPLTSRDTSPPPVVNVSQPSSSSPDLNEFTSKSDVVLINRPPTIVKRRESIMSTGPLLRSATKQASKPSETGWPCKTQLQPSLTSGKPFRPLQPDIAQLALNASLSSESVPFSQTDLSDCGSNASTL
ncbi:replication protein B [Mute swan feces associated circular virus 4]|nr:replication protein B [Mute swan feces associated circular virus 4]